MEHTYLLWASGRDRPGIVAHLTETLFRHKCNLEDSSMMRLGSEFAVFLIFTSPAHLPSEKGRHIFSALEKYSGLSIGLKKISRHQAKFVPARDNLAIIAVHGPDRPGIVYKVTHQLTRHHFNITDLSTHRTAGRPPGYILFIEGELQKKGGLKKLKRELKTLQAKLRTQISINPVTPQTI